MTRFSLRCLFALLPLLLGNCTSADFNHEWDKAMASRSGPPKDITGPWLGSWHSDANGHHGELRCVVLPEDRKSDDYRFYYHAIYGNFLTVAYTVTEQVHRNRQGNYDLRGEHNLGYFAGGLYHYEGVSTTTKMRSTYRSSADHGTFELARP